MRGRHQGIKASRHKGIWASHRLAVCSSHRRGAAVVAMVLAMLVVSLIVVGLVLGGARDQDLMLVRMDSLRAFYAAEAGANMAIREVRINDDADNDGGIGTISDDGDSGNDIGIGDVRFYVTSSVSGTVTTLESHGRSTFANRTIETELDTATDGTAMLAYGSGSSSSPRYRIWDGSAWGAEASATSIGSTPQWLVLRGSPFDDRFALATLDNDVDIEVQTWNGTAWSSLFQATNDAGEKNTRVFDLAYEQLSGHLLLVYRKSSSTNVCYRTYNGTSWSSESTYAMTANNIYWISLTPKPGSDEIMIVAYSADSSNHSRAAMWNGSSFTNQTSLTTTSLSMNHEHAAGAIESISGQGFVVYDDNDATPGYRTLTGGAWSGSLNAPTVGATPNWVQLASDPASDEILMVTFDASLDANVNVWSGSAWGTNVEVETSGADISRRAVDIAYESGGNEAIVVYDENSNTLKYRTWDGFGWSSELPGPSGGNTPLWTIQAVTGTAPGEVFVTYATDSAQIRTVQWNGSSFGSATVLATSSAPKEYETFMVATSAGGTSGTAQVTAWSEVQP